MKRLTFTVDAKLLRELGERLVGRPHIALAELIKNSYDADARHVELTFGSGVIRVVDDGHGMSEKSFVERWMRIGTTAKVAERVSPALGRPMTGSKGVGRLAVQLLATSLDLNSVALAQPNSLLDAKDQGLEPGIQARIHWPDALKKRDLTEVHVDFDAGISDLTFAGGSPHGTAIDLTDLVDDWDADAFGDLAREIWVLQPPFAVEADQAHAFEVVLKTPFEDVRKSFDAQMTALMTISDATVKGTLLESGRRGPRDAERFVLPARQRTVDGDGEIRTAAKSEPGVRQNSVPERHVLIEVDLKGAQVERFVVEIPDCQIRGLTFEFRVFDLRYRQGAGIRVDDARAYLQKFGGIRIYDTGFRLPYYGPDADWLKLELDHARRINISQLVPEHLNVRKGMLDLPSNKRVFGAVNISTAAEQAAAIEEGRQAKEALAIQITRDRLVDSPAMRQLTDAVRLSLDLYALTRAKSKARGVLRRRGGVRPDSTTAIRNASEVIEALRPNLPAQEYRTLRDSIDTVADDASQRTQEAKTYASLLGALATAGMTSLAYEHEVSKQREGIAAIARKLRQLAAEVPPEIAAALEREAEALYRWRERSMRARALFQPILDEEDRTRKARYNAKKLASEVATTMMVMARATEVDTTDIPDDLTLPEGSYAAWYAILQNLLTNAFRATLDRKPALVSIDGGSSRGSGWLRLQDNGAGMKLDDAERLFMPFERGSKITEKAKALGLGGSGLGLTIVRMITDELGAKVAFVAPDPGWSTAARIDWRE